MLEPERMWNCNLDNFIMYMSLVMLLFKISICDLRATWDKHIKLYSIPGYNSIFRSKSSTSRGLILFMEGSVAFRIINGICFMSCHSELLFIEMNIIPECFVVGIRTFLDAFMNDYWMIFQEVRNKKSPICGDYNSN